MRIITRVARAALLPMVIIGVGQWAGVRWPLAMLGVYLGVLVAVLVWWWWRGFPIPAEFRSDRR